MEEKLGFKELVCKKAATQVRRVGLEEGTGEKSQGWTKKKKAGLDIEERGVWTEN